MRQVVLDTETTGLSPKNGDRVIEIGCVEMIDRRPTGKHFHHYLNPDREVSEGAFAVHGLSTEFLQGQKRFAEVVDEFIAFIDKAELIIHNAPFDVGFLDHELALLGKHHGSLNQRCTVLDTLVMARELHPGQKNNLDILCKRYNVDNSGRELHGALLDAEILAEVYLAMTGGQTALFEDDYGQSSVEKTGLGKALNVAVSAQVKTCKVVRADTEEVSAHTRYFES